MDPEVKHIPNTLIRRKALVVSDLSLCKDVLRHFGGYLREIHVTTNDETLSLLEYIVKNCSGSLQALYIQSKLDVDQVLHLNMKTLFKHLKDLRIFSSVYDMLEYPFDACQEVVTLEIRNCDVKMAVNLLKHDIISRYYKKH